MIGRIAVGHPVDIASGAFFDRVVDAEFPGVVPNVVQRWYNTSWLGHSPAVPAAADHNELPFGIGWRASWQRILRETLAGYVLEMPDGTSFSFPLPPNQRVSTLIAPDAGAELSQRPDGLFQVVCFGLDRSPTALLFRARADGRTFDFFAEERTDLGRLTIDRDAWGRVIGLVQRREQRAVYVEYNQEGRVGRLSVRYPDGSMRMLRQFEYDGVGHLIAAQDPDGVLVQYTYDAEHRMIELRKRSGSIFGMRYDARGRCYYVSGAGRYQERTLSFDDAARRTYVRDSHGAVTTYELNAAGQCTAQIMPSGEKTRREFDADGRLISYSTEWNALARVEYDDVGRVSRIHRFDGLTRNYKYDAHHRLLESTGPTGLVTRMEYAPNGAVSRMWTPGVSNPWCFETNEWAETVSVTDPRGARRFGGHDTYGNLIWTTDWNGHTHRYEYDVRGAVTAYTDPLGQRTEYAVDARDDMIAVKEPDGRVHRREYSWDRTEVVYTLPDGRRTYVRRDSCGRVLEFSDEDGHVTRSDWDTEPRRLLRVTNPRGDTHELEYDADGRHIAVKTFDGRVYRRKWKGRLLSSMTLPDGSAVENEFDHFGRLVKQVSPDDKISYEYDANHHVVSIKSTHLADEAKGDFGATTLAFSYDAQGNCITEDQAGIVLTRKYDAVNNLLSIATSLGDETQLDVDGNGDCVAVRHRGAEVQFVLDAVGQEVRRELHGAGSLTHWWDPMGRLVGQRLAGTSGNVLMERSYAHDSDGAVSGIRDSLRGEFALAHDGRTNLLAVLRPNKECEVYVYGTTRNRIGTAVVSDGLAAFEQVRASGSALAAQRRTDLQQALSQQTFAAGDRLVESASQTMRLRYEYDASGRVIRKIRTSAEGTSTIAFEWDSVDQLRRVILPDGSAWTYHYDGLSRRIAKTSPAGETTRYVWDQFAIAQEIPPEGHPTTWIYSDGGGPIAMDNGEVHLVVADQVGAPMELLSAKGELADVVSKGTWGEGFQAKLIKQPFLGQWFDEESGLHYNLFRYYDPETARYLSPDPIGLAGGHNLFAFVPSPFDMVDPWGLHTEYKPLRKKSPSEAARQACKDRGRKSCPVYEGDTRMEADHIVPLRTIWDSSEDFRTKLTSAQQEAIGNMQLNLEAIGKSANGSRQDKTWTDWDAKGGHKTLGKSKNREFIAEMTDREKAIFVRIQEEIRKSAEDPNYLAPEDEC